MMYPFMQLDDNTEIVHSEILKDGKVKVYIEKPIEGGFKSTTCYLPEYKWVEIIDFNDDDIKNTMRLLNQQHI